MAACCNVRLPTQPGQAMRYQRCLGLKRHALRATCILSMIRAAVSPAAIVQLQIVLATPLHFARVVIPARQQELFLV